MESNNFLIEVFGKQFRSGLSDHQKELITDSFRTDQFKKKEIIFRNGDTKTRHYFVERGLLRLYIIDPKGKEINILFAREGQVIGDLATPEPTNFNLETIEDSIVHSIDEFGMQSLMKKLNLNSEMDPAHGMRRSYIHIQNRMVSLLSKTAAENYQDFTSKYPLLNQRLPQYHVASYLGISPEFLSKIIAKSIRK